MAENKLDELKKLAEEAKDGGDKEKYREVSNTLKFLEEYSKFTEGLKKYLVNEDDCSKSTGRLGLAVTAIYGMDMRGEEITDKQFRKFTEIIGQFQDDMKNGKSLVVFDNTEVAIDFLKNEEMSLKSKLLSMEDIKNSHKKFKGCIFENVNFKALENAIENKDILKGINLDGCKLVNCNVQGIEYIHSSEAKKAKQVENQEEIFKFKFNNKKSNGKTLKKLPNRQIEKNGRDNGRDNGMNI